MTVEDCLSACDQYTYAGLEYGRYLIPLVHSQLSIILLTRETVNAGVATALLQRRPKPAPKASAI